MASIEELQQSFLNAHTAGDKQAASALAAQLKLQLGQPAPATQPPPTPAPAQEQGGFIPGLMQGVAGAARSVTRPFEEATGVDTGTRAFQESVAREYPTQFTGLESFKEAPLTSATEIVGQQVPFLGEVGLGSLAGRALLGRFGALGGAFIPSALMQYEEARSKQEESGIDDKLRAIPPALAGGALDVVAGPERMLTKALFGEAAREASAKGLAKAAAKGAVVAPLQEVPTEIAQQALTRYAAAQPLTGEEAMSEYGTAGLGALIGAVPLGGAIGAAQRPAPPVAPPPPVTEPTEPETDVDPATILAEAADTVQQAPPQAQEAQQEAPVDPQAILNAQLDEQRARGDLAETGIEIGAPPPEMTLETPEPPAEAVSAKGIKVGQAPKGAEKLFEAPPPEVTEPAAEEITLETPVPKAPDGYITGRATPHGRKAFFNRNDAVAYRREIKGENAYDVIEKDDGIVLAPRPAGEVLASFPTRLAAMSFKNRKYPEAEVRRNAEGQWDTFIPPATTVPPVKTPPARELTPAETAPGIEVGEIAAEPATIPPVEPAPEPAPVEAPAISPQPVEEKPVPVQIQPETPSAVQKSEATTSLLRQERPEVGLQEVVGREPQEAAAPSKAQEEVVAPIDREYKRLVGLKSSKLLTKHGDGRALYEVKLTPEWRNKFMPGGALGRPKNTDSFELKRKEEVTRNPSDDGYVLIDKREQNARRAAPVQEPASEPADDIPGTWRNVRATDATVEVQTTEKGYSVAWAPDDVQEFRGPTAKAKAVKALQKEGYAKAGYPIVSQGKPLAKIKVKRQGIESETGRKIKVTERADEALKDVDAQIKAVEEIKQCLE